MEHHEFFISTIFNQYIANPIASLLGFHPPHDVLPAHVVMVIVVSAIVVLLALLVRRKLSVDRPGVLQQILEILVEGILGLANDIIGPNPRRFFPLLGALFIYILVGNLLGLIPGFMSPTSNINVTASCALVVFVYYNYVGLKAHGFRKYMAHFAGPSLVLAPLLFVIEIISHCARPFSLSVRLFGNIYAEELIIGTLNALFPFLLSLPVIALALFASTVQAFIFIVLTMVYLGGAVEHSDEDEEPVH
ncbi:MAG TPA: F0F1 ATP synthase subunit A [Acidobacteriota bacterium]|nr:F0F1 ATP synthase subunit A [Acidobacteriota bacterium]